MYIKLVDGQPQFYSITQLRQDNPQTSFPSEIPAERLAEYGIFPVQATDLPAFDPTTHKVVEVLPVNIDGAWVQTWQVVELSADELASLAQERSTTRRLAYQQEADPLFFKWQRGEATKEEWLDKVAEIKARGT